MSLSQSSTTRSPLSGTSSGTVTLCLWRQFHCAEPVFDRQCCPGVEEEEEEEDVEEVMMMTQ